VLLGLVIEKITGLPYREYVQKNIFDRAGMSASGFFRVSAMLRYYPGNDINVVMLSNLEQGVWEPVRKIHELIVM
jgi:CubicO group peptidase (beta-lactamase class C family)